MVLAHAGRTADSWKFYRQALISDLTDIQGGTTAEGIHLGAMGGCLKGVVTNFAGMNWQGGKLSINPGLPDTWESLKFSVLIRGDRYHIESIGDDLKLRVSQEVSQQPKTDDVVIVVADQEHAVARDTDMVFKERGEL